MPSYEDQLKLYKEQQQTPDMPEFEGLENGYEPVYFLPGRWLTPLILVIPALYIAITILELIQQSHGDDVMGLSGVALFVLCCIFYYLGRNDY